MGGSRRSVSIPAAGARLEGDLTLPPETIGMVAFAHGSGSSRRSPRNLHVALLLNERGLGTLLFDLLDPFEEQEDLRSGRLRFDIPLLGRRLVAAIDWLSTDTTTNRFQVGCFGASTGAAAAVVAAARRPQRVRAVVSRGGRPDLAADDLPAVRAPTLLIVGGADPVVLELNREAQAQMVCETRVEVVEGASHLFEEPGALDRVAVLAREWFADQLPAPVAPSGGTSSAPQTPG